MPGPRPESRGPPRLGPEPPEPGPILLTTSIEHSLEVSLTRVAGPTWGAAASQVAKRVLVWWIDPRRDLRRGDRLSMAIEFGPEGEEPTLHAIWLHSQKYDESFAAFRHKAAGHPFDRFYERDGREVESRLVGGPIESYEQVTSLLGDGRGHKGVDFKAPIGTPIEAPFAGRVVRRNWSNRANGRCVEIEGVNGVHAVFLHLSKVHVRRGQSVRAGQPIGELGNTGHSTAPHLHYQLGKNGRVLDPFRFHEIRQARLSDEDMAAFESTVDRWERMRGGI